MKKLLGLLGTIMITGNAIPSVIAAAPNRKHSIKKRQNSENTSTTPKSQDEQQSQFLANSDSKVDIIEKEITLNENYSDNIQKMLKEFMKNEKIDPLRMINNEGIITTNYFETSQKQKERKENIKIIEKLDKILELSKFNADKTIILILTLKNINNKSIRLVINLNNFYLFGFINSKNQYFYFNDEILEKIKQNNQEEIIKINDLRGKLNDLKDNKLLSNEEKIKEYLQLKNELIPLKEKEKSIKKINYNNELNSLNKKISNLQGENLKDEEEKIKVLNKSVIKKYSCKNINLNYTGAYSKQGLNAVNQNIIISQNNLNNAISNLSILDSENNQNQTTKNDLTQIIFITSEAMRFGSYLKYFNYKKDGKQIEFKNISKDIQNIINSTNDNKIQWKDYSEQLIGGWIASSKYIEEKRKEIFKNLNNVIISNEFLSKNHEDLNKILKKSLEESKNLESEIKNLIKNFYKQEKTEALEELEKLIIKNFNNLIFKNKIRIKEEKIDLTKIERLPSIFSNCNTLFGISKDTIISNNLNFLELLIIKKPELLKSKCENGWTALHFASNTGRIKSVKLLLDKAKELYKDKPEEFNKFINAKDVFNETPLHEATDQAEINKKIYIDNVDYMNYTNVVKLLLDYGANPNIINDNDNTSLHLAAMGGYKEIVQLLLDKAKELYKDKPEEFKNFINKKNKYGNTSLNLAKNYNHTEIVKLLENVCIDTSNYSQTFAGLKNIFQKTKNGISNSKISFIKTTNQNNLYDVPPDNSCLFWSVATAYLLPVKNNNEEFRNRFIQLFGDDEENLKYLEHIQKLLQQYDLENNRNLNQLWYQNQTAINLVTNVFRNRVVDYIRDNLDNPTQINSQTNINQIETFRSAIQISENEININNYLERIRQSSSWGGQLEILAIGNLLCSNINVNNRNIFETNNPNANLQIFHVNENHYNFILLQNTNEENIINSQEKNTNIQKQQKLTKAEKPKTNITILNKSTVNNNTNLSVNKPIKINIINSQETIIKKAINKYNALSKEEKQQKLNEINQHYQSLPENEQKAFKDKLRGVGLGLTSTGISGAGILGISKMTGISPIKGLSTTANYIKNSLSTTRTVVSSETGEAVKMTPLLSESTVAEGLTAAETLSVTEGSTVVATEWAVIGTEAGTAAALAPETLGLSLIIGGLVIAGTAILWWINSDHTIVKHESHNQYNEIEKYYKFLAHDQLKLDININEWNKIKQIYQKNESNYQEFKNKIKSEITNFHKEDHSGWGGSITDNDINTLINILYNHFQEINNHFLSNPNHSWKIVTNTIGSYFIIEEE